MKGWIQTWSREHVEGFSVEIQDIAVVVFQMLLQVWLPSAKLSKLCKTREGLADLRIRVN